MRNKVIYLSLFIFTLAFTACDDKDEFDYTSAGVMGGEWCVTIDGDDTDTYIIRTSNTAADQAGELLLTDQGAFWDFTVKVNNNLTDLSFSTATDGAKNMVIYDEVADKKDYNGDGDQKDLVEYDILVKVKGGKITQKAVKLPSGVIADKIEFTIAFEDDSTPFSHEYKIVGYRVTGFDEDVDHPYIGN